VTKKARREAARALIDAHPVNVEWTGEKTYQMNALLGSSYLGFMRKNNPRYPSDKRHLWALSDDGWSDVSWNDWISPKAHIQRVKIAMRQAIAPDIAEAMATLGQSQCQSCATTDNLTVDHKILPFDMLAMLFLGQLGYVPELISQPDGVGEMFEDCADEAQWIAYHARHSTYQVLCRSCNASKGKRT
jgi:5-methylcytosine-specific restriction endonuclease McrA